MSIRKRVPKRPNPRRVEAILAAATFVVEVAALVVAIVAAHH